MEEWKEYKYTDLCTLIGGGTPKTSEPSYWGGHIPWLSVKDFGNDGKYVYSTEKSITDAGLNNSSTKLLKKDDIIISARGTIGAIAMLSSEMAFNQSCFGIRSNALVDQHYLYYLTKTKIAELQKNSHGSVFDTITRDTFAKLDCLIPPFEKQKAIASILSSLDDKIEVNRRINDNLEQQAQALFKSWFVDFEPFKDGEFVESELGMIPKGWRVGVIQDLASKMASGGTPTSTNRDYYGGDVLWYSTKELNDNFLFDSEKHISQLGLDNSSAKLFPEDTVLMAIYAAPTVGRLGVLSHEATFNQAAVGIVAREEIGYEYIYLLLLSERKNLNNLACGVAQQNLNVGIVKNYKCIIPSKSVLSSFRNYITQIFLQQKELQNESRRLAQLRDTLLPRLMSGELKVNEIENAI